jgi:hypothetical protein
MINLERLLGKESAWKLRNAGLHKLAAERLRSEGHPVDGDLNLRSAIQALGTNLYIKNAEYKNIVDGIMCLGALAEDQPDG